MPRERKPRRCQYRSLALLLHPPQRPPLPPPTLLPKRAKQLLPLPYSILRPLPIRIPTGLQSQLRRIWKEKGRRKIRFSSLTTSTIVGEPTSTSFNSTSIPNTSPNRKNIVA